VTEEKKHGKTKPTQRSLKHLRENGWTVHIVEKYLPPRGGMKFGVRIDVYGFGDILACRGEMKVIDGDPIPGRIALIQTTTGHGGNFAAHRDKILAIPEFYEWKKSGGKVFLHGWRFGGARGEKKRWILREEEL
jgi:hypothetical protein